MERTPVCAASRGLAFDEARNVIHVGAESALSLARGTRLTSTDVLALPRVPEAALLSACDAGRGTFGIARALLLAGTRRLVAPTRPIGDAAALAFTRGSYTALAGDRDMASATRTAQLARRAQGDPSWSAMRVLVRSLEVARRNE